MWINIEENTVFEAEGQDCGKSSPDWKLFDGEANAAMDSASLRLLNCSTIDYTMELIESQFKVVGNPRAMSSRGCGTSKLFHQLATWIFRGGLFGTSIH